MILLIDNYDSFVYNLYQFMAQTDPDVRIVRNDRITLQEISEMNPDLIVLSPGPGRTEDAGICISLVQNLKGKNWERISRSWGCVWDIRQSPPHSEVR